MSTSVSLTWRAEKDGVRRTQTGWAMVECVGSGDSLIKYAAPHRVSHPSPDPCPNSHACMHASASDLRLRIKLMRTYRKVYSV
jgi:hypothetical protein